MRFAIALGLLLALPSAPAAATVVDSVPKPRGKHPIAFYDPAFPRVKVTRDVPYATVTDPQGNPQTLALDLYEPATGTTRERPAVVWVHGGGFRTGTKRNGNVVALAEESAKRGYVAISIDYRLLAGQPCGGTPNPNGQCLAAFAAAVADAKAAVGWLRERGRRLRLDPGRVGIGGTSAGAVTAQLVGLDARSSHVGAAIAISGGIPGDPAVPRGAAPTLFFQGTNDPTTPYETAKRNADKLSAARVPVIFETLQGAGHVPFQQYKARFIRDSAAFLYEHLGLAPAARR